VKEQVEAERKEDSRTIAAWNLSQPHSSIQLSKLPFFHPYGTRHGSICTDTITMMWS
jgi:hypothetical protein